MIYLLQIFVAIYVSLSVVLNNLAVCEENVTEIETHRPHPTAVEPPPPSTAGTARNHRYLNVTGGGDGGNCDPEPDAVTVSVVTTARTMSRAGRSVNGTSTAVPKTTKPHQKPQKTTPRPWPQGGGAAKPKGHKPSKATPRTTIGTTSGTTTTHWPKSEQRLPPPDVRTPNRTNGSVAPADFKDQYLAQSGKWKDHGFYTDDYIQLINVHWFKFRPPADTAHYVLGILYTIIMVFGCFGNSLVIFMYIK